jgi:hypothetical protein
VEPSAYVQFLTNPAYIGDRTIIEIICFAGRYCLCSQLAYYRTLFSPSFSIYVSPGIGGIIRYMESVETNFILQLLDLS